MSLKLGPITLGSPFREGQATGATQQGMNFAKQQQGLWQDYVPKAASALSGFASRPAAWGTALSAYGQNAMGAPGYGPALDRLDQYTSGAPAWGSGLAMAGQRAGETPWGLGLKRMYDRTMSAPSYAGTLEGMQRRADGTIPAMEGFFRQHEGDVARQTAQNEGGIFNRLVQNGTLQSGMAADANLGLRRAQTEALNKTRLGLQQYGYEQQGNNYDRLLAAQQADEARRAGELGAYTQTEMAGAGQQQHAANAFAQLQMQGADQQRQGLAQNATLQMAGAGQQRDAIMSYVRALMSGDQQQADYWRTVMQGAGDQGAQGQVGIHNAGLQYQQQADAQMAPWQQLAGMAGNYFSGGMTGLAGGLAGGGGGRTSGTALNSGMGASRPLYSWTNPATETVPWR